MLGPHSCAVGCTPQPFPPGNRENFDGEFRQLAASVIEKRPIRIIPIMGTGLRWLEATCLLFLVATITPALLNNFFVGGLAYNFGKFEPVARDKVLRHDITELLKSRPTSPGIKRITSHPASHQCWAHCSAAR